MKKINPFKKLYYDSIREIEIKSGESMSERGKKLFLIGWIGIALLILYLVIVIFIQPVIGKVFGLTSEEPPISVHLMKNHSLSSVIVYDDSPANLDEIGLNTYKQSDTMYYIVSLNDDKYIKTYAYTGIAGMNYEEIELKHLSGNQYFLEFVKNKDETIRYVFRLEDAEGNIDIYTFAYDSI